MYIMTPITGFHTGVLAGGRDSECTCRDLYRIRPKQFFGRGNLGLRGGGGGERLLGGYIPLLPSV